MEMDRVPRFDSFTGNSYAEISANILAFSALGAQRTSIRI
jgi:hypothetical protein